MPRRIYQNEAHTGLLASDIDSSQTTGIQVDTVDGWPTPGTNEVAIGAFDFGDQSRIELFSYTGIDTSGANPEFTGVTRGIDGSTAQSHSSNTRVRHVISAKDLMSAQLDAESIDRSPGRSFGSNFTPNASRPVFVRYTVLIALSDGQRGRVNLLSDASGTPTTAVDRTGLQNDSGGTVKIRGTVAHLVPPGHSVKIESDDLTGTPTQTLGDQVEITL